LAEPERGAARRLFQLVLEPIREVQPKARLVIVPDGVLNLIGFDSLISESGRFVLRSHTIGYAPSATVLVTLRKQRENTEAPFTLLAFGGPRRGEFDRKNVPPEGMKRGLLDPTGGSIPDLTVAIDEVKEIASISPGKSKMFLGSDATEAQFKQEALRDFRVIHLAAHAFADLV
jgi:CHAT domain-containing protein